MITLGSGSGFEVTVAGVSTATAVVCSTAALAGSDTGSAAISGSSPSASTIAADADGAGVHRPVSPQSAIAAARTWSLETTAFPDSRARRIASAASALIARGTPFVRSWISLHVRRGNTLAPSPPAAVTR